MLSELVGNTIYDKDVKIFHLLFALALWTCLSIGLEKLSILFPRLGRLASGKPELLIHNRKIIYPAMKRNNLDFEQLHAMLRQSGVFAISQVEYAVLETNGSLSVMLKSDVEEGEREDLQPPTAEVVLPVALVVNGRIDAASLRDLGKDGGWLVRELLKQDVEDVKKDFVRRMERRGRACTCSSNPDKNGKPDLLGRLHVRYNFEANSIKEEYEDGKSIDLRSQKSGYGYDLLRDRLRGA
ncbi:DUF421 domain-containing protein [Cohnella ginsengisoli]|uniref:DUF421 domain-containing protein n=1 Tax=Cohnella ginsengisoli TaxID=425004 RepID=A0A9X4QPM1_9BACL|nr:YetF domain-containing protein [Cohnella ginsengisoli]MDG0793671.1 DUF421 domain-containing protein [Cohnella ginsengisoli]